MSADLLRRAATWLRDDRVSKGPWEFTARVALAEWLDQTARHVDARNPFRWLRTRNAAITSRRVADAARTKGGLFAKDQTPDLEPLSDDDRALLELGGPETIRPGERIALTSGRIVTGWELAQMAPDLLTLEILGDHDRFVAEELARDPELRRIYTALDQTPDDLMAVADGVFETLCCHRWDVDPDVDSGVHTVQHLCVVAIPSHGYHECACGVWRMEIGATP